MQAATDSKQQTVPAETPPADRLVAVDLPFDVSCHRWMPEAAQPKRPVTYASVSRSTGFVKISVVAPYSIRRPRYMKAV